MSILNNGDLKRKRRLIFLGVGLAIVFAALSSPLQAHPMDEQNAAFVQAVDGVAVFPFMYLGAKHMVTGYDHLLFLVGVIFFLYKIKDVVLYVSLFTLGHSANPHFRGGSVDPPPRFSV